MVFLVPTVRREGQLPLFEAALDDVRNNPDLVGTVLDVTLDEAGMPTVARKDSQREAAARDRTSAGQVAGTERNATGLTDRGRP